MTAPVASGWRGCRAPALETAIGTRSRPDIASMAGYVVIRIAERLGGGEPLRIAYAVAEPNQHRAIALFKLRPDHTADEQVEAVVELSQSALDSLGLKAGMIKPL